MRTALTLFLFVLLSAATLLAQSPPYMNYQGVARSTDGTLMQNRAISLRLSILKDGPVGHAVYTERHTVETNDFGMFTLRIGGGDLRQGALDALDWAKSGYWLQVEMDENGGSNYALLGASQLLSVPYAFHALHADKADKLTSGDASGGGTTTNNSSNGSPWSTRGNVNTDAALDFVGTSDDEALVFRTDNLERMRLTAYGKLGIGETDPVSLVDVAGNVTIGSNYAGTYVAPDNGLLVEGVVGIGVPYPAADLEVAGELVVGANITGKYLPPPNGALFEGSVGIGTQSPRSMLGVKGGIAVGNKFSENEAPTNGAAIEGKLGVGTTIPKSTAGVAGNVSIGSQYAREFEAPSNGLIVQGDVGIATEAPLSNLGVAGNTAIGSNYASTYPAPEDGLLVEGPIWSGVTESIYAFHVKGNSYLDGTAEITGNTKVGGTLDVDGVTTLRDLTDVPVIKKMKESSDANFLGSLHVLGGAGIRKNANVGEDLGVRRDTYVGRNLAVGGTANFKNLVVENHAEIGTNPDPNFDADLNPTPKAPVTFTNKGETILEKKTKVTDATASTSKTTGALVVTGGVGVGQNLNVGGQLHVNTNKTISSSQRDLYPVLVQGSNQGIAIKLNETTTSSNNYYVGFWDNSSLRGRIEGETFGERIGSLEYVLMTLGHVFDATDAALELIAEIADFRVGVGLGAVTVTPGVVKIAYAAAKIILLAANIIVEQTSYLTEWGVGYTSGNADYAEWLERADPEETFMFGDIVGVQGGKISRTVSEGDMVMVISKSPIVLGNVPAPGREHLYEKCAFLGQVPVKVVGPVNVGDYIIPSGRNNGVGHAVAPSAMTAAQAGQVVGVAWSALADGIAGYVNVAVGMPVKAGVEVLQKQQETISTLEQRVGAMESVLRELIPDFDQRMAAMGLDTKAEGGVAASPAGQGVVDPLPGDDDPGNRKADPELLTEDIFNRAVGIARDNYRTGGQDPDSNPVLRRLNEDPGFRATYLQAMRAMVASGGNRAELERIIKEVAQP
ncbi:MAG TPA: hypothetical protein PK916_15975 [Bacteroidota bacterium]|nr:hypothetical protein [Bacteroidota bacterium]